VNPPIEIEVMASESIGEYQCDLEALKNLAKKSKKKAG
jgi:hypothetical protein